jgi:hypothetical protein
LALAAGSLTLPPKPANASCVPSVICCDSDCACTRRCFANCLCQEFCTCE